MVLTIQLSTRPVAGDVLLPSPFIDVLLGEVKARTGHGNKADPAENLLCRVSEECFEKHIPPTILLGLFMGSRRRWT